MQPNRVGRAFDARTDFCDSSTETLDVFTGWLREMRLIRGSGEKVSAHEPPREAQQARRKVQVRLSYEGESRRDTPTLRSMRRSRRRQRQITVREGARRRAVAAADASSERRKQIARSAHVRRVYTGLKAGNALAVRRSRRTQMFTIATHSHTRARTRRGSVLRAREHIRQELGWVSVCRRLDGRRWTRTAFPLDFRYAKAAGKNTKIE